MKIKSALHLSAKVYAQKFGLKVFPCKAKDKTPATIYGCKDATWNSEQIDQWWYQNPDYNVGLACGNGFCVLDIDGELGKESLRELEKKHSPLPQTPMSLTGNGFHFFFKTDQDLPNKVSFFPGIDIRSNGGYVVAPPSIHPNGKQYSWEISARIDEIKFAPIPDWLINQIEPFGKMEVKSIEHWQSIVKGSKKGTRNHDLASLTGYLLQKDIDAYVVLDLLLALNSYRNIPPLEEGEVIKIVNSIAGRDLQRIRRKYHVQ